VSKNSSNILKRLIRLSGHQVLVPFYHAVTDKPLHFTTALYPPRSITNFKRDLNVLLKHYIPISLQELITITVSQKSPEQPVFHLTFDDGLVNFYNEVAPILLDKNIPATVFLNTAFIDNKELFFRYKASLLLRHYRASTPNIAQLYIQFIKKTTKEKTGVADFLLGVSYQNKNVLDELANLVGFSFTDFLAREKPYLTTTQIKELQQKGFSFGAHSVDHPLFADLSLTDQVKQVSESLDWLSKNIQTTPKVFSFPFEDLDVSKAFFDRVKLAMSFGTYGLKKDSISNNLQRISFELAEDNITKFLIKAHLRYLVKILFRKHKIIRK